MGVKSDKEHPAVVLSHSESLVSLSLHACQRREEGEVYTFACGLVGCWVCLHFSLFQTLSECVCVLWMWNGNQ